MRLAPNLLRSHVRRRSGDFSFAQTLHVLVDGQPEVGHTRTPFCVEQNIGALQVSVYQSRLVRIIDGIGNLRDQSGGG